MKSENSHLDEQQLRMERMISMIMRHDAKKNERGSNDNKEKNKDEDDEKGDLIFGFLFVCSVTVTMVLSNERDNLI